MAGYAEERLSGRQRGRLRRARERGYLDARCRENTALVRAYGLWCWRLKIPLVFVEKRSRYSRFARVRLEMFTAGMRLAPAGQTAMKAICAPANTAEWTRVSADEASWDHVALASAADLARTVLRAALRHGHTEIPVARRPVKLLRIEAPRSAVG